MKKKSITIVYNTSHYIYMFRLNLIRKLQAEGYSIIAIAPYDKYSDKLVEEGVQFVPINIDNKGINPLKDIKLFFDLFLIYKKLAPNVILHFTIKPNIYGSLAARFLHVPLINNITGLGTVFLKDNFLKKVSIFMYKVAFPKVNMVFFQNNDDKKIFIKNKIVVENRCFILPGSGVDTNKFYPQKKTRTKHSIVFLLIARIIRDKGIVEYVEAARLIKKKYDNVEFQILGQLGVVNKSAITKKEVELWEKQNIINYLGEKEDVRENIANADCIVLPSYREGTSKTLLEAASMGKPIITTDVPGCNNIVIHKENGFLCKVRDTHDLIEKIEEMMKLPIGEREIMGKKGRKRMIDIFEEKKVINKYIEVIKNIINSSN